MKPVHKQQYQTGCVSFPHQNLLWIKESVQGGISGFRLMARVAANLFQRPVRVKKSAQTLLLGKILNPLKL